MCNYRIQYICGPVHLLSKFTNNSKFLFQDREERHWPSVISILTDRAEELSSQEKVVYVSDEAS